MAHFRLNRASACLAATAVALGASVGVQAQQVLGPAGNARPDAVARGVGTETAPGETGFLDLDGSLAYTDNAALTGATHRSDAIAMAGFDTDYLRTGGRLEASLLGQIDWMQYVRGTFGGQPYGHFLGNVVWGRPAEILQWVLNEAFGEGAANPLLSPSPANLEYVNYVTTGPYLNIPFGPTDRLTFHGLYSNVTYQDLPYDDQGLDGGARFTHALSPLSSVSLQADYVRTMFTGNAAAPSYDTRTASLDYRIGGERTTLTAVAGYTMLDYRGPQSGAPLFSLEVSRKVSDFSTVFARVLTGFTTVGQSLSGDLGTPVSSATLSEATPIAASTAPFKERSASLGWDFNRARTTFSLYGTITEEQYQQAVGPTGATSGVLLPEGDLGQEAGTLDGIGESSMRQVRGLDLLGTATNSSSLNNTFKSVSASFSRKLRPTLTFGLQANHSWARYQNLNGSYQDTYAVASLGQQFTKTLVAVYAARRHHTSSSSVVGIDNAAFNEDLVGIYVTYDLVGSRHLGSAGGTMPAGLPGLPGF